MSYGQKNAVRGKFIHSDFFLLVGMPKSVVVQYTKLQQMLLDSASSTKSLSESKVPATKKYRFELQKAINITVNSISANSGEGLIEKIGRLRTLIGGQSVDVMGKPVNTAEHPEAKLYCCNLLAKKLVVCQKQYTNINKEVGVPSQKIIQARRVSSLSDIPT